MPEKLTDDKSTLVQVMAWCRQATSHYKVDSVLCCHVASLGPNELINSLTNIVSVDDMLPNSTMPLSEQMLTYYQLRSIQGLKNNFIEILFEIKILIQENTSENVVSKRAAILFRPQTNLLIQWSRDKMAIIL